MMGKHKYRIVKKKVPMTFSEVFNYCPNNGLARRTGKYPTFLKSPKCYTFWKKP